ncbi:MAG: neutral/alkaline non-lysosomal ceramidase N-terminal domain-containing protein [Erysipelotrichaceae bacterium]|nr:neutral/alkaline non-lysosomal ceramidase N-terminal domain-containing protein [Erysipelotrichaceae bacterium]
MFKFSNSNRVISPSTPQYFAGHAQRKEKSTGVHDDLYTYCFHFLTQDGNHFLWIEIDIIKTDLIMTNQIKQRVAKYYGIAEDNVVICAGHSHSAPLLDDSRMPDMPCDQVYKQYVIDKTVENAIACDTEMIEAKMAFSYGEVLGFFGNRNDPKRSADQMAYLLKIFDVNDNCIAAITSINVHPTVLSPTCLEVSADLVGAIRSKLEKALAVPVLYVNGVTGDISTKYFRQSADFVELERISNGVSDIILHFSDYQLLEIDRIETRTFDHNIHFATNKERYNRLIEHHTKALETEQDFDSRKWLMSQLNNFKKRVSVDFVDINLRTTIVNLNDLELIAIPGDPVSFFGQKLKESSTKKLCLPLCHANGENTYLVEAWEFSKGHSGLSTQLLKGQAEEYFGIVMQNMFVD